MPGEKNQLLRDFIIPRMCKGVIYSGAGQSARISLFFLSFLLF